MEDFDELEQEEQELKEAKSTRRTRRPRAPRLRWKRVRSSNVHSIAYDENEFVLYVKFLDLSVYKYYDVDPDIWSEFVMAPSKGRFVWTHLRDVYEYERVS